MKSVRMERTSTTFAALTIGHAEAGYMAAVEQTMDQASRTGVAFSQGQLATLVFTLARAGHAGDNFVNLEWVSSFWFLFAFYVNLCSVLCHFCCDSLTLVTDAHVYDYSLICP